MEAERPKSFTPRARKFERPEGGPDGLTDAVEGELGNGCIIVRCDCCLAMDGGGRPPPEATTSGEFRRRGSIVLPVFLTGRRRRNVHRQEAKEWQKPRWLDSNHDDLGRETNHRVRPYSHHLYLRSHKQVQCIWCCKSSRWPWQTRCTWSTKEIRICDTRIDACYACKMYLHTFHIVLLVRDQQFTRLQPPLRYDLERHKTPSR
jgi:hypothetical protein